MPDESPSQHVPPASADAPAARPAAPTPDPGGDGSAHEVRADPAEPQVRADPAEPQARADPAEPQDPVRHPLEQPGDGPIDDGASGHAGRSDEPMAADDPGSSGTAAPPGPEEASDEDAPRPLPAGEPARDDSYLQRARRNEERARRSQAREEARRMRLEARRIVAEARRLEKQRALREAHMERVSLASEALGYDADRPITEVPELPAHMEQVEFHAIEEDRSFIRLAFDTESNTYLYELIEPQLTLNEEKVKTFVRDTLIRTLDGRRTHDTDWAAYLRDAVHRAIVDHDILVDSISTERIMYYLVRDFLGYGPIDGLMRDDKLEDISCDGPGIPIYVFHRQYESIRTNVAFDEELDIDSFVIRLAQRSGKHISIADPLLDATLPDGSRLQATLSREVTSRGSSFTIRKFREEPFTPPDLIDYRTMTTPMCAYFWFMMEEGHSLLLAGGTASGKTTTLNAVCQFIPPEKKIVSIEDTREINLLHENWIAGVTRSGFGGESLTGKRAGTIDMYRLLEAALRQRPEYLLVGEVRGPEALTLFQAMATGHAVYSTMHADSTKSAVYRLENPPINVPRMMLQTLDTVAIQAQVKVGGKTARRVKEVVEIIGFDPDTNDLLTNTVFYWDAASDRHVFTGHSGVFDGIREKKGWSEEEFQQEWERRMLVLEWLRRQGVSHLRDFSRTIQEYYQRPEKVIERIEAAGFTMDAAVSRGSVRDVIAMFDIAPDGGDAMGEGHAEPGHGPGGDGLDRTEKAAREAARRAAQGGQ